MKNMIRFILGVFIVVLIIGSCTIQANAEVQIPAATSDFYVNDFANVFSKEEKSRLMNNAIELANNYDGVQVVVTTIDSLEGMSVSTYGYKMYNKYAIGKNDMGVLILLSIKGPMSEPVKSFISIRVEGAI